MTGERGVQAPFERDPGRTWVGWMENERERTPVMYDPTLPGVPTGQVYLYHADRGALVPYQRRIVVGFLRDADGEERKELRRVMNAGWKRARREFLRGRTVRRVPAAAEEAEEQEADEE